MPLHSSLNFLVILSSLPFTVAANYAYPPFTAGMTYSGEGWAAACFSEAAACWDSCSSLFAFGQSTTPQVFTYTFAVPSTNWFWYGYKTDGTGSAEVCFDGATTGCDIVSYSDTSAVLGADPAVLLYTKTGLSNAVHTVKVTNVADNTGTTGPLNVDHMEIEGGTPRFPSNTFVSSMPFVSSDYRVDMSFGSTPEPSNSTSLP